MQILLQYHLFQIPLPSLVHRAHPAECVAVFYLLQLVIYQLAASVHDMKIVFSMPSLSLQVDIRRYLLSPFQQRGLWVRTVAAAAVLYTDEGCFWCLFFGKLHESTLQRPDLIQALTLYKSISTGWCVRSRAPFNLTDCIFLSLLSHHFKALSFYKPFCPVSLINGLSWRKNWGINQGKKIVAFDGALCKKAAH